jgi:hypothetical protein
VLQKEWSGQRVIELEGPRRYAPNDVAAAFAAVLDHDVEAKVLPWAEWCELHLSCGLTPCPAAAMVEMLNGFNTGWIAKRAIENDTQINIDLDPGRSANLNYLDFRSGRRAGDE